MLDAQPLMMSLYPLPTWRHLGDLCVNEPKTKISRFFINPLPPAAESEGVL